MRKTPGTDQAVATPSTVQLPSTPTRTATGSAAADLQPYLDSAPLRALDRYEILNEHGRGGIGRVSRAHDRELGREVAIKELISRGRLSEARFLREALITARLEHPGIVPVHEAGRWPDGTPFYAMKLVAGRPLRDLIAERPTVDQRVGLLHHVIAVADAIAYAHGRNIIHRDLKPANVIVGDFGETIVIDWGLAKDLSAAEDAFEEGGPFREVHDRDLTRAGAVLGTPAYMAPEQERGERVDQRADVFAIGAMLWELCSLEKVPPTHLRQRNRLLRRAGIDQDLAVIIDKALDPDPGRRYPDAGALAADLKAFKSGARIAARNYTFLAMLAHWTRRHRALSLAVTMAVILAVGGVAAYVHNIAAERDRADAALTVADAQRRAANTERDRARLSEANAQLGKDPTYARQLLTEMHAETPQHALLMARSQQRAASHVWHVHGNVATLRLAETGELLVGTNFGELYRANTGPDALTLVDKDLTGAIVRGDATWLYARAKQGEPTTVVSSTPAPTHAYVIGHLLAEGNGSLYFINHQLYALEPKGDLYRIEKDGPHEIQSGVHSVAGNDHLFLTCTSAGKLLVTRDGAPLDSASCSTNESFSALATSGIHYAALRDNRTLLRDQATFRLPAPVSGEFALALTGDGLLAFADFSGDAWFVRPMSDHIEPAPRRAASPTSVAASGPLVGWGYQDGSVVAMDTQTGATWQFMGHSDGVYHLLIDAQHKRVISAAKGEIRAWELSANPLQRVSDLPCTPFHLVATHRPDEFAFDCNDGSVNVWHRDSNAIERAHRHTDIAFGIAVIKDQICSGSWDGRVLCSDRSGHTVEKYRGSGRVVWLTTCHDESCLLAATVDGGVWRLDGTPRLLFSHGDSPYRLAVSDDDRWLASVAFDGSLIVYDLQTNQVLARTAAHTGYVTNVAWRGAELWTAGVDHRIVHWDVSERGIAQHQTFLMPDAVKLLRLTPNGWFAAAEPNLVFASMGSERFQVDVDKLVRDLQESPDHRFMAMSTVREVVVFDQMANKLTVLPYDMGGLDCMRFLSPTTLAVCTSAGVSVADLTMSVFTSFSNKEM